MSSAFSLGASKSGISSDFAGGIAGGLFGLANTGLQALINAGSAKKSLAYQRELMHQQYLYQRELNRTAYQDTTSSMREAGINPMLAITQGINSLSAGSGGSVNVQPPDAPFSSALEYMNYKQAKKLNESQVDKNKAEERATDAMAEKTYQDIENSKAMTKATISNLNSNTAKTTHEISGTIQEGIERSNWIKRHPKLYGFGLGLQTMAPGLFGIGTASAGISTAVQKHREYKHENTIKKLIKKH